MLTVIFLFKKHTRFKKKVLSLPVKKVFRMLSRTDPTEIPNCLKIMDTGNRKFGETGYLRNEPKAPRTSLLPEDIESERLRHVDEIRNELEGVTRQDILRECEEKHLST